MTAIFEVRNVWKKDINHLVLEGQILEGNVMDGMVMLVPLNRTTDMKIDIQSYEIHDNISLYIFCEDEFEIDIIIGLNLINDTFILKVE